MRKFEPVTSPVVSLPLDNINTDEIIPARFLTRTERQGWGACLFADWRQKSGFALNSFQPMQAAILLAGSNFGCGSSREHAVWALRDFGFRAIIAPSFADIFRENAIKNGLLPAVMETQDCIELANQIAAGRAICTIDLPNQSIHCEGSVFPFQIEPFAKMCLIGGIDDLEYILSHDYAITAHEVFANT